jgi:choice-of-anchor A domain-containing protein
MTKLKLLSATTLAKFLGFLIPQAILVPERVFVPCRINPVSSTTPNPKLNLSSMRLLKFISALCLAVVFTVSVNAQSPTAPANGFNVFLLNNATLSTNETEGAVAIGGDLTIAGNYQVNIHNVGNFTVSGIPIGLAVGNKVIFQSGSLQVNNSRYVKIGDCGNSNLKVWYRDNNNALSHIYITPSASSYSSTPNIHLNASANAWGAEVSAINNPVCDPNISNLLNFSTAFTQMQSSATCISGLTANATLTNPNGNVTGSTITSVLTGGQLKITLNSGTNVLNVTGAELNSVTNGITFNNAPDASHVLVINVNAAGSFTWNVWNQAGIGFSNAPYIIYNFYNTTSLNIAGNSTIEGTVFAPNADITKTVNQANIEGQVIAKSLNHAGGEIHYAPFSPTITCNAAPCSNPTVPDITGNSSVCKTATTTLANTTSGGTWSSSNTTIATVDANGVVTGVAAGSAAISYAVTNACGTTTKTKTIIVNEAPTVADITGAASVCKNATTTFADITTGGTWSSSNTAIATVDANAVVTGVAAGTATISYSVTNSCGITSKTKVVTVNDCSSSTTLTANFSYVGSGCSIGAEAYSFTNSTTGGTAPITYSWNFGDGGNSSLEGPSHSYLYPNSYTVTLVATDANGATSTKTATIQSVAGSKPVADFNIIQNTLNGSSYTFISTSTISNGSMNYFWRLGDGTTATAINPTKTYGAVGTYNVTLIVTGSNGCVDSITKTVTITTGTNVPDSCTAPIVATFIGNDSSQCITDNHYIFTNTTLGCGGCALTYKWTFGDGTFAYTRDADHVYSNYGEYDVVLKVTDCHGNSSEFVKQIYIGSKPHASFNTLTNTGTGQQYTFVSTSSTAVGPITYAWDLGNGVTSILNSPTVTLTPGTYNITLVVTGRSTCKDTAVQNITVTPAPVANFTYGSTGCGTALETFVFTNTSSGVAAPLTYVWNFGDGSTSTDASPTHAYLYPSNYTITLTVTDANGGKATKTVSVQTLAGTKPAVNFNTLTNTLNGSSFTFISTSTVGSGWMNYYWDLGDGSTSTLVNPTKTYAALGTYNVKLIVTNGSTGCKDSITKTITVNVVQGSNVPPITASPNPVISNTVIGFTPTTTGTVYIKIYNNVGVLMQTQQTTVTSAYALNTVSVNMTGLATGYYHATLVDSYGTQIGSILIFKN